MTIDVVKWSGRLSTCREVTRLASRSFRPRNLLLPAAVSCQSPLRPDHWVGLPSQLESHICPWHSGSLVEHPTRGAHRFLPLRSAVTVPTRHVYLGPWFPSVEVITAAVVAVSPSEGEQESVSRARAAYCPGWLHRTGPSCMLACIHPFFACPPPTPWRFVPMDGDYFRCNAWRCADGGFNNNKNFHILGPGPSRQPSGMGPHVLKNGSWEAISQVGSDRCPPPAPHNQFLAQQRAVHTVQPVGN